MEGNLLDVDGEHVGPYEYITLVHYDLTPFWQDSSFLDLAPRKRENACKIVCMLQTPDCSWFSNLFT